MVYRLNSVCSISVILTVLIFGLISCEDDSVENPCDFDFDQQQMFSDLTDEVILPAQDSMQITFNALEGAAETFVETPSSENLDALREEYIAAYMAWQGVRVYSFGPAGEEMLGVKVNSYPLDENLLQSNLDVQSVEFESETNKYARGFPALDYLLFGLEAGPSAIVNRYEEDERTGEYLLNNLEFMHNQFEPVWQMWDNGYAQNFINNTGTAEGTSLSQLINQLNRQYENARRNKLGIPSGIAALGNKNPDAVEAPYSERSLELLEQSLIGMRSAFTAGDGLGLDDYLEAAEARSSTDEPLEEVILQQFESALEEIGEIPAPLSTAIEGDDSSISGAYQALANQTVYLKTDMSSALCVSITYTDNPSDSD